jgi:hypothetical protein
MMLAKNDNTFNVETKLEHAIFLQNIAAINAGKYESCISYEAIEDYYKTFWRIWDWDYKRCVSPDILEKLKPYIV